MSIVALVGAQYGSEGKGAIAAAVAHKFDIHVRTGGPNAGHTIIHNGVRHAMRSVPCGWVSPNAHLVIGPGALIDLQLLIEEVKELDSLGYDVSSRLFVDRRAGLIDDVHREFEGGVGGHAHKVIGSTGEGVGPARMARIARGTFRKPSPAWTHFESVDDRKEELTSLGIRVHPHVNGWLDACLDMGSNVLLEGTQGAGLSLIHGHWPYVTSHDTNAGQLLTDAGLGPGNFHHTILVARTYPIRVAGNSGPLFEETSWEEIGVPPEYTTVTGKMRRVGNWNKEQVNHAIGLNFPAVLALTFFDYMNPEIKGSTEWDKVKTEIGGFRVDAPVDFVGTGPDTVAINPKSRYAQ